jgi:hypothetical protein
MIRTLQYHAIHRAIDVHMECTLTTFLKDGERGGTLRNNAGERFMFHYIPAFFRVETADSEAEADGWYRAACVRHFMTIHCFPCLLLQLDEAPPRTPSRCERGPSH